MPSTAIDFTTAFGRLLRDGALRDAFARNREITVAAMPVREHDRPALAQLNSEDLEFQATVLLRKRFGEVRRHLPLTIERLGDESWTAFHRYARNQWPAGNDIAAHDALGFCAHLVTAGDKRISRAEWNRLHFATGGKGWKVHWVRGNDLPSGRRGWGGWQVLVRNRNGRTREHLVTMGI